MTHSTPKSPEQILVDAVTRQESGQSDLFIRHQKELEKAGKSLGKTLVQATRWLVEFLNADLEALSPSKIQGLAYKVAYFSIFGSRTGQAISSYRLLFENRSSDGWSILASKRYSIPNRHDLLALQKQIQTLTDELIENKTTSLHLSSAVLHINIIKFNLPAVRTIFCDRIADSFLYHATWPLSVYGARLKRCNDKTICGKFYLSKRVAQLFCSDRCRGRVAKRRQRKRSTKKGT